MKFRVGDGLCVLKMSFHLENINLIGKRYKRLLLYSPSTAQHIFLFLKFPFLWNSGSAMDYVFRKWFFIWKILIWLENVIRVYCCTRLAQLSTTFCFLKFLFLWNPGSVIDYMFRKLVFIWKILIWLQNVIRVYCSTRLPQLSTTFVFKIPIFVKFRVGDGLCTSKTSFHLENINLIGKCYRGLLLYSPSTAQQNFCF